MKNSCYPLRVSDFRVLAFKIKQALQDRHVLESQRGNEYDKEIIDAIVKGINDFYE